MCKYLITILFAFFVAFFVTSCGVLCPDDEECSGIVHGTYQVADVGLVYSTCPERFVDMPCNLAPDVQGDMMVIDDERWCGRESASTVDWMCDIEYFRVTECRCDFLVDWWLVTSRFGDVDCFEYYKVTWTRN